MRSSSQAYLLCSAALILVILSGCSQRISWRPPRFAEPCRVLRPFSPEYLAVLSTGSTGTPVSIPPIDEGPLANITFDLMGRAEAAYAAAVESERQGLHQCVDQYYLAAQNCWQILPASPRGADKQGCRAWSLYHSSVAKLVINAARYGRFDQQRGIRLNTPQGPMQLAVQYKNFYWTPQDFDDPVATALDRTT